MLRDFRRNIWADVERVPGHLRLELHTLTLLKMIQINSLERSALYTASNVYCSGSIISGADSDKAF